MFAAAGVASLACSGSQATGVTGGAGTGGGAGAGGTSGDDQAFVPAGLPNTNVNGADEGLTLVGFTLAQGATGAALYAAVKNESDTPSCEPGMMTYFYDPTGNLLTSAASPILAAQLYQLSDGTIIPCIEPGGIGMTGSADLPAEVVIANLGSLQHLFPTFTVNGIVGIGGFTVSGVQTVPMGSGSAYTGTVTNGLDEGVTSPSVTIFPVNASGRPLGMATASATSSVPAGGSWSFQTTAVDDPGVGYDAFPAATTP